MLFSSAGPVKWTVQRYADMPRSWCLNRHVIIETNKTTARIFPEVPDCETPQFWEHMEKLIVLNKCAFVFCPS